MATVGGTSAIIQLGGADSFKIGTRRGLSIAGTLTDAPHFAMLLWLRVALFILVGVRLLVSR
jgi:hypothetical protein